MTRIRHRRALGRAPLVDLAPEDELAVRTSGEPAAVLAALHALDADLTTLQRLRLHGALRSAERGETYGAVRMIAIVQASRR